MGDLTKLAQEIDRVPLHDITERLPFETLREWASLKPCQIGSLAATLREDLVSGVSPFCISLWKRWAEILPIRDTILEQESAVLSSWIVQADHAQNGAASKSVQDVCVTMLSHPLPDHAALPNTVQSLTKTTLNAATNQPSAASLRAVYRLLNGTKAILLDIIPEDDLKNFLLVCQQALRSLNDQIGPLLCLAIFAQIANGFQETMFSTPGCGDSLGQSPNNNKARREAISILNGKHTNKTLDLAVMHAIICCSDGKNITAAEATERLQLIKETLATIESSRKAQWAEAHRSRIQKLFEKILRPEIEFEIQLTALSVCSTLVPIQNVPNVVLDLSTSILLDGRNVGFGANTEPVLESIADWISPVLLGEDTSLKGSASMRGFNATSYVQNMVDICRPGQRLTTDLFRSLRHSLQVTKCFSSVLATSTFLCKVLSTKAILELIPDWWNLDLRLDEHGQHENSGCTQSLICPHGMENLRIELVSHLSFLIVQAGCLANFETADHSSVMMCFTKLCGRLGVREMKRSDETSRKKPIRRADAICEIGAAIVGSDAGASRQWTGKLRQELMNNASANSMKVIDLVGSICRDLEDRCNTVEKPLREATTQCAQLASDKDVAETKNKELQKVLEQERTYSESVSADKMRLASKLESMSSELASSVKEIKRLELRIESERLSTERKEEEAAADEVGRQALIAVLEEKVSCKEADLIDLKAEKKTHGEGLACVQNECNLLRQEAQDRSRAHEERVHSLEEEKDSISTGMENEVRTVQKQLEQVSNDLDQRTKIWTEREHDLQDEAKYARERETEVRAYFESQLRQIHLMHDEELRSLKVILEAVERRAVLDVERGDSQVKSLQRKLNDDAKKRKAQAQELKEEREVKRRLLSIIEPSRKNSRAATPSDDLASPSPLADDITSKPNVVGDLTNCGARSSRLSKVSSFKNLETRPPIGLRPTTKPTQASVTSSIISFREPGQMSTPVELPGAPHLVPLRYPLCSTNVRSTPVPESVARFSRQSEVPNTRKGRLFLEEETPLKENSLLSQDCSQELATDSSIDEIELAEL